MKTMNQIIGATHILSTASCGYLDLYSIHQPIEVNNIFFKLSLTDGLILSIFLFAVVFIGNIFGSVASFLNFSVYPLLSLGLGLAGIFALLLFLKAVNLFLFLFGIISLFQIMASIWVIFRSINLMKIGE